MATLSNLSKAPLSEFFSIAFSHIATRLTKATSPSVGRPL